MCIGFYIWRGLCFGDFFIIGNQTPIILRLRLTLLKAGKEGRVVFIERGRKTPLYDAVVV